MLDNFKIFDNFEKWDNFDNWDFLTILTTETTDTIFDNFDNWKDSTGDIWDTDYNSDNWEPEFMTIDCDTG